MWNYWPLKFADKASADAILYTSGVPNWQNIDVTGNVTSLRLAGMS